MSIVFKDNSATVMAAMTAAVESYLYEAGGELQAGIQRNSRVDTGQTKGSYGYHVDSGAKESAVYVGSNYENAIWEEFGTGEFALNGDGRKGSWVYRSATGEFYRTRGKKPNRPMYNAFQSLESKLKSRLETVLRTKV